MACAPGPAPHRTAPLLPLLSPISTPLDHHSTTTTTSTHSRSHSSLTHNQQREARTSCKSCICLSNSTAQHSRSSTRRRELDSSRSTPGPPTLHSPSAALAPPEPSTARKSTPPPPSPPRSTQNTATSPPQPPCSASDTNPPYTHPTSKQHTSATVRRLRRFWPCETSRAVALPSILVTQGKLSSSDFSLAELS